ncbi:glycogen debranching enzyme [Striga asiatica]|uniref:Glycogen debranching enzyme n=1 Tax=Striga asiatica TaxID=4170 RepID=A0A5A7Q9W7_STRAF|nr:glycogen debranching enzyme [Striga asiatica]
MELQLRPLPNYCLPKFTSAKYLRCRKNKFGVGIPNKSSANTGKMPRSSVILNDASESGDLETTVVVEKPLVKPRRFEILSGLPAPFGATARDGGVNFAVFSSNASSATLCLISLSDLPEKRVTEQIALNPLTNKTGDVWHIFLKGNFEDMVYGFKFGGIFSPEDGLYFDSSKVLIDPYAKAVVSRGEYGALGPDEDCWPQMACIVPSTNDEFDWEGDLPLRFPQRDLVIYEMHVRGFTKHVSSNAKFPGTYLGVVEKLDYLKNLGVNCIELMPCHEFNELEYYSYNSVLGDYKMNFWGYSTINFFSPMARYSSAGTANYGIGAVHEFKYLVREAHKRGIEVIMDVVFNHTAEGNENGPLVSFRGLDNSGEYYNYSGCGNTFNCNHPVVRQFIVDCLRYWVIDMHVDGFRFDLASILTRSSSLWDAVNTHGGSVEGETVTTGTPLFSPPLIDMISNDPILSGVKLIAEAWDCGGLYQVGMFPHWGIWSEWNGKVGGRKPWNSINFVCAHDGFTLADLVTYNNKHNLANGEDNKDGENHNNSWNCGQEGEFASLSVKKLRLRQMRNFYVCLMVSQGVPMIYMGDEYGHTKGGNNNTYCHDNYIDSVKGELYIAFNASHVAVTVALPERLGYRWEPLVDTGKPTPFDFLSNDLPERETAIKQYAHFLDNNLYPMLSYSSIVLLLSPDNNNT